ncbi:hydroxymethylglutaryl-CoA lyase [Pseudalkalibacillus salsuginis]|uniref:hydroxymethylglutaryl-CoA lyase n=1 Tax=Pseudalkalibacillus salsuginis TaxID=2910972 RepID=UPI001F1C2D5C|nr:hydroxymethylglutaryl-CoA lyase [Pseudalkalibacillus salsuginis]MCF6411593.1 hydroxymethylglutaryl-CoA lyase [Pseudalkalibacillus salsuginis]
MIEICEVGPRDGIQNEAKFVPTETKVALIEKLIDSGIRYIEAVSFVNPKVVPQMADAEALLTKLPVRDDIKYAGLILSRSGLERALKTDIGHLHVATTTSDSFNLKNVKRTVADATEELTKVAADGVSDDRKVIGVLGTAFGCPFEGEVPVERVLKVAESFLKAGSRGITLADTTGMANPNQVSEVVGSFRKAFGEDLDLSLHFHNTRGLGLANVLAGYQAGVKRFDSSIAGLGGCPFAPKAVGNVCTEDMVNMFHGMGDATGTDLEQLVETAKWMEQNMGRSLDGMLMKAGIA